MEGGVGDFTRELSLALHALGHDVHVLTTVSKDAPYQSSDRDLNIYRAIKNWGWGIHGAITRWINTIAPDIVNIQYEAAAYQMKGNINFYPRFQKPNIAAPIVVTYHDLLPPYLFPKAGVLRPWSVRQLAQYADGIIATNNSDYNELIQRLEKPVPPVRMIPIGSNIAPIPPEGYAPEMWRVEHNFDTDDILIGFFGFLNRTKGIETLLEAIAQLAQQDLPVQLLLIGGRTGSSDITNIQYANEIDALITELDLGERVHRTGSLSPAEVSAALLAIDVCALPYREGASLRHGTLHAALAHGCAIITTKAETAPPELYNGENVILIPPENTEQLAQAILTLEADTPTRQRLGHAAAALAQTFSWEGIAKQTVAFFRELVK